MIKFDFDKYCYGCKNCENICPKNAIKVRKNNEGFFMPEIDESKCIECGMCEKICPYLNFKKQEEKLEEKEWYSSYLINEKERINSTSGGIFPVLADEILKEDGIVCACTWNCNMQAIHIVGKNKQDINKMKKSKYVQSDMNNVVKILKEKVKKQKILFVGTPCQVAAVKLYLNNEDNLYTCGLICEGVPSNKVWDKYVEYLQNKYKGKILEADFRCKDKLGWQTPEAKYVFDNKKIRRTLSFNYDLYVAGFLEGLYYRKSCNNCQYKENGHNADVIIGDLWGADKQKLEKTNNKGISVLIVNTNKGKTLKNKIEKYINMEKIEPQKVIPFNKLLMESIKEHNRRNEFFDNLEKENICKNIKRNIRKKKILKNNIKQVIYKIGLYKKLKEIKNNGRG